MEDYKIVDLYWARDERGIAESDRKYGRILYSLSLSLLDSREDAEECVNDTYLHAWNAMPTARPDYLGAFLSKITRRVSIDRFRSEHRQKRGGMGNVLEELSECVASPDTVLSEYQNGQIAAAIDAFLATLKPEQRVMFVRRYFYTQSINEIALALRVSEAKVKVTLHRLREILRKELEAQELL